MDPVTALQWVNAGSNLLNAVGGAQGRGAAPGFASSGPASSKAENDFSGFTVATGNAKATGATISKNPTDSIGAAADDKPSGIGSLSPGLVMAGAAALGLLWNAGA